MIVKLSIPDFIKVVAQRSLLSMAPLWLWAALAASILYQDHPWWLASTPLTAAAIHIGSYACHEAGHYVAASLSRSKPSFVILPNSIAVSSTPQTRWQSAGISLAGIAAGTLSATVLGMLASMTMPGNRLIPAMTVLYSLSHCAMLAPAFADGRAIFKPNKELLST